MTIKPTDTLKLCISGRLFAAVAQARASNDIRYYLKGVYIQKADQGGVYIAATNGHAMLVAYDKDGTFDWVTAAGPDDEKDTIRTGVILHTTDAMVREAAKPRPKERRPGIEAPQVVVEGGRVSVAMGAGMAGTDAEFYIQPGRVSIDGNFPQWARSLPNFPKLVRGHAGSFSEHLFVMMRNASAIALHGTKRRTRCNFNGLQLWGEPENPNVSCAVQFLYAPEMMGIIMPIRDEAPEAWARAVEGTFKAEWAKHYQKKEGA